MYISFSTEPFGFCLTGACLGPGMGACNNNNNNLYFMPRKVYNRKYIQREKLTIKIEHSHSGIAKSNRAKWLDKI